MAARLHPAPWRQQEVIDLRHLSAEDLEPLLEEETAAWRAELEWDFDKSADLVHRFVDMRALSGSALIEDGAVAGYMYYVLEENKGLIGDLYVRRGLRTPDRESLLLKAALEPLLQTPSLDRVESQLMMLSHSPQRELPYAAYLSSFERNFMRLDLQRCTLPKGQVRRAMYIEKWSEHYQDQSAQLIAAAYSGHIDSRINDQYRTPLGARRFLFNIVQYPGCGAFYRPGSFAAFEGLNGRLCGISLASIVAPNCGHITQICVSPWVRGTGIGYELLRQSLNALRAAGCTSASLTVTAANEDAVLLYERVGFQTVRRFSAFVWEGF
ncbi:MAG TPA: GNAT family N-acetyltransferase [Candidatus Acidoferrales bacterium]|jgi:ribosomal protein S18 acetylase RimI-like enzyme|nr:GNAT family N-acetyltransferase [Candidatus Acidoferrales bacterium]